MVCTLEIEIGKRVGTSSYPVEVRATGGGEASGVLQLDRDRLEARRGELQNSVIASAVPYTRGVGSTAELPVREVGTALFSALMTGHVYGQYSAARALASSRGEPLRIVLRLQPAELAALPWEMLFDDEHDAYLCKQEPLIRHVKFPAPAPPVVSGPLRVLGLVAAPSDLPRLDAVGEQQRLGAALAPLAGRVDLRWADGGSWDALRQALTDGPWHVIHFIGHGDFDAQAQQGTLALEGTDGRAHWVHADRIRDLISIQNPAPRLVVLNSCSSGRSSSDDVFSSTAATLVRGGCCAVVAMQYAITDAGAKAFAESLYQAIATNHTISDAVRIARIGIAGPDESLEWATPVLYLRGDEALDVPLFAVTPGTGPERIPAPVVVPAPTPRYPEPSEAATAVRPLTSAAPASTGTVKPRRRVGPTGVALVLALVVVAAVAAVALARLVFPGSPGAPPAEVPGASSKASVPLSSLTFAPITQQAITGAADAPPPPQGSVGGQSPVAEVTTPPSVPAAVAAVTVDGIAQTSLAVSWKPSSGATGYEISYRDDTASGGWTAQEDAAATVRNVTLSGLTPGHTYTVRVVAHNAVGSARATTGSGSTVAEPTSILLAAPTLRMTSAETNLMWVEWSAVPGAAGYRLDWVESPGGFRWDGEAPYYGAERRSAQLTGMKPGYSYAVTIRAFDASGNYGRPTIETFRTKTS